MPTIGHFYLFSLTDRWPASRAGEIKWVLCYDWLPERTGRAYFACTGSPDLSPGKTLILFSLFNKLVRSRWREWNRSCSKTLEKRNRLTGTSILFPQVSRMDSAASSLIGWKALCCKQVERDNETKAKIPHVSVDWSVDVQQWSKGNAKICQRISFQGTWPWGHSMFTNNIAEVLITYLALFTSLLY